MKIEEAIRAAAENGYGYRYYKANELGHLDGYNGLPFREIEQHVLDPDFWRCLGKAKGWRHEFGAWDMQSRPHKVPEWQFNMYCLIDHLADGGTITSFFQDL